MTVCIVDTTNMDLLHKRFKIVIIVLLMEICTERSYEDLLLMFHLTISHRLLSPIPLRTKNIYNKQWKSFSDLVKYECGRYGVSQTKGCVDGYVFHIHKFYMKLLFIIRKCQSGPRSK